MTGRAVKRQLSKWPKDLMDIVRTERSCPFSATFFPALKEGERMASHTLHVVQAFEERDGGIVPVEPKACPSAGAARALVSRLLQNHVGVIAWSRTGDPDLGEWGPPEILVRTGVIPDEFEAGGGVE